MSAEGAWIALGIVGNFEPEVRVRDDDCVIKRLLVVFYRRHGLAAARVIGNDITPGAHPSKVELSGSHGDGIPVQPSRGEFVLRVERPCEEGENRPDAFLCPRGLAEAAPTANLRLMFCARTSIPKACSCKSNGCSR